MNAEKMIPVDTPEMAHRQKLNRAAARAIDEGRIAWLEMEYAGCKIGVFHPARSQTLCVAVQYRSCGTTILRGFGLEDFLGTLCTPLCESCESSALALRLRIVLFDWHYNRFLGLAKIVAGGDASPWSPLR